MYAINLNDKQSKEIHWVSLFFNKNTDQMCALLSRNKGKSITHNTCFFYVGFLSRTFTIHKTSGEGGGEDDNRVFHSI